MNDMGAVTSLASLLENSAARHPAGPAVSLAEQGGLTYAELDARANRVRDRLVHLGVKPGDRVGLRLHKSVDGVTLIFGILKAGAAYVPVDADSPAARGAYIHNDCAVRAVFTEQALAEPFAAELAKLGAKPHLFALQPGSGLVGLLDELDAAGAAPTSATVAAKLDDVAYILYTSGSTGNPKGVVLTHGNALSFIDWCSDVFKPTASDRFSSHAPFHFDLSILDLYVSIKHGAALVLFGEALGKEPQRLAAAIASEKISMWYSTPSILSLLANFGKLERHDYSNLRVINFAGEVFPLPQYRAVKALLPHPTYFNLYGPTETNVCTWYEVPADPAAIEGMSTFPIGPVCPPNRAMVVAEDGQVVPRGSPGELLINGPNVMRGYWNLPENNARAFHIDASGAPWYRTGDIVTEHPEGFRYVSRRDRMVKRRGYRVELGEIETVLSRHADIREAAVVAIPDPDSGVRVCAFVAPHDGKALTRITLKTIASKGLPPYMIPDQFFITDKLARTSTDKIDYQTLKNAASAPQ
jgi:amino acid adenylation domain-containing protein